MSNFAESTVLITGSTKGIGRASAELFAARGAHVIVSGRDVSDGESVVSRIRENGGKADFVAADLANADSVRTLARRAIELGGGHVDVLVNNAGIFPNAPTVSFSDDQIANVYDINVKAPFILVAELAPSMAARGAGSIVNVLTIVVHIGVPGTALYGSSKAALAQLTRAWAGEFGPSGVRVNAVSPGPTRTEGTVPMGEKLEQIAKLAPAGRPAVPEEIASAIVYLASDEASFIQGAILDVDGGRTAV